MPSALTTPRPFLTRLGWKKDSPDSRDFKFSAMRSPLKDMAVANGDEDYEIDDSKIVVFDQLNEDSCVANAWTAELLILMYIEFGQVPAMLSRQFLYWTARCLSIQQSVDGGTFLRNGAKALATTGICLENIWPYDVAKVLTSPDEEAFFDASNNLLLGYYSVTDIGLALADDLETAIKANHPVVFGTQVGQEFMDYTGAAADVNKVFDAPEINIKGGHALCLSGVRRLKGNRQFKVRNSWSNQWGLGGYCWFSEEYIINTMSSDFWVGTRMNLPAAA